MRYAESNIPSATSKEAETRDIKSAGSFVKEPYIRIDDLTKHYQQKSGVVKAVDHVTLAIGKGEFVALLGPSGCGKSTTLMLLAGLIEPSSGDIYFHGKRVTHLPPKDRNIGMVFQSYALYPDMNVLENICFPLKNRGVPKEERIAAARRAARTLNIGELLERKTHELSGGQQQRVAIARAIVKNPDILLLDEPMSNLDARLKIDMRDELRRLQQEIGITSVLVTHDQEEALAVADRVAILDHGVLQDNDTPEVLYNKPRNLFIARFLGTPPMNFLPCRLEKSGNSILITSGGELLLESPATEALRAHEGEDGLTIGVRPYDFRVTDDEGCLRAKVELIEHLGREILIKASYGQPNAGGLRILQDKSTGISVADVIGLRIADNYQLFDSLGNRITGGTPC